jgi:hypothetical protein
MFPLVLREDLREITEIFVNTEQHLVCNLSFGLFDDSKMVGYMFAYVESTSLYYDREVKRLLGDTSIGEIMGESR